MWWPRKNARRYATAFGGYALSSASGYGGRATKPIYGGGSNTTTITRRRQPRKRNMGFMQRVLKNTGACHYTTAEDSNAALRHNHFQVLVPTAGIPQGTANNQRVGDEIYLCALKIQGLINTPAASGAYSYRIIVGWTNNEEATTGFYSHFTEGSFSATSVFLPSTAQAVGLSGIVDPKKFTTLDDRTFDLNSQVASTSDVITVSYTVPINQKFVYQSSAAQYGKFKNLIVVMIPVKIGAAFNDACGSNLLCTDLIFKNY